LLVSATQAVSVSAETKTPSGYLKLLFPEPKPEPNVVLLLQVVESLSGRVQIEIRLLLLSATQAVSVSAETKMPAGLSNLLAPEPSVPNWVL
jgi:hypothetical protein